MTLTKLIDKLRTINRAYPNEEEKNHTRMDKALLDYINSFSVREEFDKYSKWYSEGKEG